MSNIQFLLYEDELAKEFCHQLRSATHFSIGMALITLGGLETIASSVEVCLKRGGTGRVLIGIDLPTPPEAIETLVEWQAGHPDQLDVRIFESGISRIFHPKLAIFHAAKSRSAIVGSANLTDGGFHKNYEASTLVTDAAAVQTLTDYFDEHFKGGHARAISEKWLSRYRAEFVLRDKAVKALRKARDRVRRLRGKAISGRQTPTRIRGFKFAFTGKIQDWPRDAILYPSVRCLGGEIAEKADSMARADCLVHADILGGRESTQKLGVAAQRDIPVITEDEFFRLIKRELGLRKK